jgi:hypothetical protein
MAADWSYNNAAGPRELTARIGNGSVNAVRRLNAMQAEAKLYDIVTNPDIAVVERHWDDLHRLDMARDNVQPNLKWAAIINNRDQLMNSELWEQMSDKMKAWCIVLDDAEVDAITREVIRQVMLDYDEHREETMTHDTRT